MEIQKHDKTLADKLYATPEYLRRVKVMTALWNRMTGFFGAAWVSSYGEVGGEGFNTWMDALGILTEDKIARGVKSCMEWSGDYPPNVAQFTKLCMTSRPEEKPNYTERRIEQEKQTGKKISLIEHLKRKAITPTAKREIKRMEKIYAGENVESKEESMTNLGLHRRWQS